MGSRVSGVKIYKLLGIFAEILILSRCSFTSKTLFREGTKQISAVLEFGVVGIRE